MGESALMAICYFCNRVDFKNAQAVKAHPRACPWYQDREREEELYQVVRSIGFLEQPIGASEAQLRARFEAEQVERGRRPPPRALCSFCGRDGLHEWAGRPSPLATV